MKKSAILLLGLLAAFSSCKKAEHDSAPAPRPSTFADIKASSSFNWSSERTVTVSIKGNATQEPVTDKLTIFSGSGAELVSMNYNMNDSKDIEVSLPASETQIKMQFGQINKTTDAASAVSFDFLPVVDVDNTLQ